MNFADRIIEAGNQKASRLVVGLDPHWNMIPQSFKDQMGDVSPAEIVAAFMEEVVSVTIQDAVAYKPQIAFFEQFGSAGLQALDRVIDAIDAHQGIVLMDAKRGDIGSTAAAYARAFFGDDTLPAGFPSDALTINAYLGSDGVKPFIRQDKGIFILVKTSNPSSGELQDQKLQNDLTVSTHMARQVAAWNQETLGQSGYGNVGAVIGATYPEHMSQLRKELPQSLLLVPGYGAQGGAEAAVTAAFNPDQHGALINSSRGILFPKEGGSFKGIAAAASAARKHIQSLLPQA